MSMQITKLCNKILHNVYRNEVFLLNKINSLGILPYLPDELVKYILQFLVTITDYIDYYIDKMYNVKEIHFDSEILPYIVQLHNNPNKDEICKTWDYGEEFLLISERHKDLVAFYIIWCNWGKSFICDLEIQIKCISKHRSEIINKKLLEYLMPINKILRIDYLCGMYGNSDKWEKDLGSYFQKIIDMPSEEQNELFSIWKHEYVSAFKFAIKNHENGKKEYYSNNPNASWMCSFITDFMMYLYH